MKILVLLTAFLIIFVNLSHQLPKLVNCGADYTLPASVFNSCGVFTCDGRNKISGVDCGTWQCRPDKYLGYKETDNSKPYPECCGGPICDD